MADEELTPELYACNGCIEQIPQHRARISCHSCPDYHLCANCFVIKQFVKPHTVSHATLILKRSGVVVPPPPGFNAKTGPALPPRPTISVNTGTSPAPRAVVRTQPEMPTANWGALWNVLKPKDKRMRQASVVDSNIKEVDKRTVSSDSMMSGTHGSAESTPPLPLRPIAPIRMESQAPSYPMPDKWEPLFEADSTPNSIFVALMSTIFSQLDPEHTGVLRPETYSDFLDLQGYELGSNIWRYAYESDGGEQSKDVADLELGLYYADLNISHTLMIRPKDSTPKHSLDEPSSAVEERIKDSLRFSANMPMLSRQGFIDLGAIEYLREPTKGHKYLILVITKYGIWTELGDMPRSVLPEVSISKEILADKMDSEPEDTVSTVLLAEKLVKEEEQEIESESQDGFVSEELSASSSPTLPMRVRGGEAKIAALTKKESFDERRAEIAERGKTDAMIKISEVENQDEERRPTASKENEVKEEVIQSIEKDKDHDDLYEDEKI